MIIIIINMSKTFSRGFPPGMKRSRMKRSNQRIQVEIDEIALKRLMAQKKLTVEEFRCLITESKLHLQRLFLDMAFVPGQER